LDGVSSQTAEHKICWITCPPITPRNWSRSLQAKGGALEDMFWLGALNSLQRVPSLMLNI